MAVCLRIHFVIHLPDPEVLRSSCINNFLLGKAGCGGLHLYSKIIFNQTCGLSRKWSSSVAHLLLPVSSLTSTQLQQQQSYVMGYRQRLRRDAKRLSARERILSAMHSAQSQRTFIGLMRPLPSSSNRSRSVLESPPTLTNLRGNAHSVQASTATYLAQRRRSLQRTLNKHFRV